MSLYGAITHYAIHDGRINTLVVMAGDITLYRMVKSGPHRHPLTPYITAICGHRSNPPSNPNLVNLTAHNFAHLYEQVKHVGEAYVDIAHTVRTIGATLTVRHT